MLSYLMILSFKYYLEQYYHNFIFFLPTARPFFWTSFTFWPPLCTSLLHVLSFMSRTSVQRISAVFAAFGFYELESMFPGTRQHKCGGGGVRFFVLFFISKTIKTKQNNVARHKAAQVWSRRGCAHKNLTPHGKSQGRSIFYKPLSASPYFALSHCMFFQICMAMGFSTCSKRSVTKPNENLLHL